MSAPPSIDTARVVTRALNERLAQARRESAELAAHHLRDRDALAAARAALAETSAKLQDQIRDADCERRRLQQEHDSQRLRQQDELDSIRAQLERARQEQRRTIEAFTGSTSWRLTAPLRAAVRGARRVAIRTPRRG